MSKFTIATQGAMKTVNKEGHVAYKMDWRSKLMTMVLTSFFNESKFYGDNSKELTDILTSGILDDPEFVSNLAIFARREFNMRSVSHVLAGYLANIKNGKPYVKRTVKNIVLRGDDATEILAFYLSTFGKPIPNSLRKALKEVITTFDKYTLGKYKGEGHSVKMRDILCLCRPKPLNEEQSANWKALLEGNLEAPYTWEVELSAKGNKKETWEELIDSGKVGYMALLRNLRNILNAEPENIQKVFDKLAEPEAVRKSRQLPFRFLSAYREVMRLNGWEVKGALESLEKAADAAVENLPKIPGKTIIAIDVSGSMTGCYVSGKSDIRASDISILLGIIADRICEKSMVYLFDDQLYEAKGINARNGLLNSVVNTNCHGGGTNMYLPFEYILDKNIKADRIIVLSDNECNYAMQNGFRSFWYRSSRGGTVQALADEYRRTINPDFWVHAVDLAGYGTQQFIGPKMNLITGWSEKIFEFIMLAEQGEDSLIKRIQNYKAHSEE